MGLTPRRPLWTETFTIVRSSGGLRRQGAIDRGSCWGSPLEPADIQWISGLMLILCPRLKLR